MKNFILFGFLGLALTACGFLSNNLERVGAMSFYLFIDSVEDSIDSEINLRIVPNYESRSLDVKYSKHFLNKSDLNVDMNTEGVLAGEFFDKFENVLSVLSRVDQESLPSEANFKIVVESVIDSEPEKEWGFVWDSNISSIPEVQEFFLDLTNRFSEDVY